jgi:[protein-PII] uridylyltransferase
MASQLLERLDFPDEDRRFVLFLVEHHQDMVVIAQRRDLDDYKMIAEFARLFASMEWLKALYLLSYADLSAVVSDAWTDWQGALLWELYYKTSEQFQSGMKTFEDKQHARQLLDQYLKRLRGVWPALKIAAFQEHVEQLPPHYLLAYEQDQVELHQSLLERLGEKNVEVEFIEHPGHTEILVCSRDQRQLLAKICGSLAVNDINILRADVHTRDDDMVLDIFRVTDVDGSPVLPDWKKARVRERLEEVVTLRLKARELLERYSVQWDRRKHKARDRKPEVVIENQVSDRYTVIDVSVQDEVGLLYKITHTLAELDLDIHMAIINTVARRAADSFYVVDDQGRKIVNYEVLEDVRQSLIEKLGA